MECEEFRERLHAFVDGECSSRLETRMAEHLQSCDDCRRHVTATRDLVGLLEGVETPPVPEGFSREVLRKVKTNRSGTSRRVPRRLAAAVVAIGLAVGILGVTLPAYQGGETPVVDTASYVEDTLSAFSVAPAGSLAAGFLVAENDEVMAENNELNNELEDETDE